MSLLNKMIYVDNIDWLQISFKSNRHRYYEFDKYQFKLRPVGTSAFREIYDVVAVEINEVVGEFLALPREGFLDKDFKQFRFKNRFIYTDDYKRIFKDLKKFFGFGENYNITRIDLCRDFQKFYKGLLPETFIRKTQSQEYILKGKRQPAQKAVERHNYEKYTKVVETTILTEKNEYKTTTFSKKYDGVVKPETLYISKGSAFISKTLYNKTQEMKDKRLKSHIKDLHDRYFNPEDGDVWRLEFSLKGSIVNIVRTLTGETGKMKIEDLDNISGLINALISTRYTFWKNHGNRLKNRSRDWDTLDLFNPDDLAKTEFEIGRIEFKSDSGRAEKIYLKRLAVHDLESRTYDELKYEFGEEITNKFYSKLVGNYANEHNLSDYLAKKILPYRKSYNKVEKGR